MAISDTCDMHMVSVKIAKLCYWQESTRFESVKTGTYLLYKTITYLEKGITQMTMDLTMEKWLFVAPALILLLFGCGQNIKVQHIDKESRPPNTGKLDIYNSAEEVKRPYKTIEIVRAEHYVLPGRDDDDLMKRKTIAKAKESGADGLIITKSGTRNVRVRDGMGGSHHYSLIYIESEAIIYLDK